MTMWKTETIQYGTPGQAYAYTYTLHTAEISFGFCDRFRRDVGCKLIIEEIPDRLCPIEFGVMVPTKATIRSRVQATRAGKKYGAIPRDMEHATLEGAKASVIKRGAASAKRQAKSYQGVL